MFELLEFGSMRGVRSLRLLRCQRAARINRGRIDAFIVRKIHAPSEELLAARSFWCDYISKIDAEMARRAIESIFES